MCHLKVFLLTFLLSCSVESLRFIQSDTSQLESTQSEASNIVTLPLGNIEGIACSNRHEVVRFLGVPFAEPPLGELRFRPPVPYSRQYPSPALPAKKYPHPCGSLCAKVDSFIGTTYSSENCLYLNIWVPRRVLNSSLPVAVKAYIHGGHDLTCSASDPFVDGCDYAAKTGTIQVNMQYRKGPFGHLAHPDTIIESNTTGNWAIMDQQLALKWIQENIQFFGGDPNKVVLVGHSQGGQYVDYHTIAPNSAGLFRSIISQSPPCVRQLTVEKAFYLTKEFSDRLGCTSANDSSLGSLECLRKKPWSTLFAATEEMVSELGASYAMCESLVWTSTFQAVVDGVVLPYHVVTALKDGNFHKVPYMVGFSTNEGNFFVEDMEVSNSTFDSVVQATYPGASTIGLQSLYPMKYYEGLGAPLRAQVADLWTDLFFKCPILDRLLYRSKSNTSDIAPTYLYQFDVTPTCPVAWQYLGAYHSVDLIPTMGITEFINPPDGTCNFTLKEVTISNTTLFAWTTMAEIGVPLWGGQEPKPWAAWDPKDQLGTFLNVDGTGTKVINLRDRCEVIQEAKAASAKYLSLIPFSSSK